MNASGIDNTVNDSHVSTSCHCLLGESVCNIFLLLFLFWFCSTMLVCQPCAVFNATSYVNLSDYRIVCVFFFFLFLVSLSAKNIHWRIRILNQVRFEMTTSTEACCTVQRSRATARQYAISIRIKLNHIYLMLTDCLYYIIALLFSLCFTIYRYPILWLAKRTMSPHAKHCCDGRDDRPPAIRAFVSTILPDRGAMVWPFRHSSIAIDPICLTGVKQDRLGRVNVSKRLSMLSKRNTVLHDSWIQKVSWIIIIFMAGIHIAHI